MRNVIQIAPLVRPGQAIAPRPCGCGCSGKKANLGFTLPESAQTVLDQLKAMDWRMWALIGVASYFIYREYFADKETVRPRRRKG